MTSIGLHVSLKTVSILPQKSA